MCQCWGLDRNICVSVGVWTEIFVLALGFGQKYLCECWGLDRNICVSVGVWTEIFVLALGFGQKYLCECWGLDRNICVSVGVWTEIFVSVLGFGQKYLCQCWGLDRNICVSVGVWTEPDTCCWNIEQKRPVVAELFEFIEQKRPVVAELFEFGQKRLSTARDVGWQGKYNSRQVDLPHPLPHSPSALDHVTDTFHAISFPMNPSFKNQVFLQTDFPGLACGLVRTFTCYRHRIGGLVLGARLESGRSRHEPGLRWVLSGSSHTSDLNIGIPVAPLPGAWCCRVSPGTGRAGVSIL